MKHLVVTSAGLAGQPATDGGGGSGGSGPGGGSVQVHVRVTPGAEYAKVVALHGRVVGAMLVGETDLEETLENLILNRLDGA